MDNATTIVLSRLIAQTRAMDVTATNIANASTPGFRAERTVFADFLVREGARALPPGDASLAYTADRETFRDATPGTLTRTGNPLDIAISGAGFFTVQTGNGPRLTRAGRFAIGPAGELVDSSGNRLLDTTGQPIQVGATDTQITVAADGSITSQNGTLGKLGIVAPADEARLHAEGGRLFSAQDTTTAPATSAKLVQGAIEGSNVQPIAETTRMMNDLREFQFVSQFVQSESEREQGAIDKILQAKS